SGIDPALVDALKRLEGHFRSDARCLAMYLLGSAGNGTADPYSDLDITVVVRDEEYAAMAGELRRVCERLCGPVVAWLPRGEADGFCNYAFLFEADERLLLLDLAVHTARALAQRQNRPGRVLFDHAGILADQHDSATKPVNAADLQRAIETYWVYMSLNG